MLNFLRLAKHKIIQSSKCATCEPEVDENDEHLFHLCKRATKVWQAIEKELNLQITTEARHIGITDKWLNNIISLAKQTLSIQRDKEINIPNLLTKIRNRCIDLSVRVFTTFAILPHVALSSSKVGKSGSEAIRLKLG